MENSNCIVMVFLIIFATSSAISFCNGNLDMLCSQNERQALLTFKQDLKDPMNQLSNWDESANCCDWTGIVCNKATGHVLELHLANNLGGDWQFLENALLVSKGREFEYSTLLKLVVSLDLSDNNLLGKIPEELTRLVQLQSLNLSMNRLSGQIPSKIGDMELLESLDLSRNQLSGQLPPSIASLSFLSHLNLSYNNLTGRIPTSTQLQSLDGSSFIVNQLCGPPLAQNCSESNAMPPGVEEEEEEEDREGNLLEQSGFHLSLGLGFAIGFWTVLGSLLFNMPWSIVCHRLLDIAVLKLYSIIVEYI